MGVQWAIILGTAELEKGVVSLKNFKNGEQKEISLKDLETFGF